MSRPTKPLMTIAAATLLLTAWPAVSTAKLHHTLHGQWTVTLTPDDAGGNAKEKSDTFTFTNGDQFTSTWMEKEGFAPANYAGRQSPIGAAEQFETTLTNKAGDSAKWQGQNLGNELTGTVTVTRKNGDTVSYSFKGTRK